MVNVTFTPNGVKNSNAANTVKILSPDTVKQGDTKNDFLVQLIKDGVPLDLTGKTVTWSAASNKGKFITDRPATVEGDGTVGIEFTGDDVGATGSLRVEFKVTYADGDIEKFPAQDYAYFQITRSLDDLSHVPVMYASVQYFESKVTETQALAVEAQTAASTAQTAASTAQASALTAEEKAVAMEAQISQLATDGPVLSVNGQSGIVDGLATQQSVDGVTAQLAETVKKEELNALGQLKLNGTYATLTELQTAFPTGATGLYLVTADGYVYRWNNSAWVQTVQFQSTGIENRSVSAGKLSSQLQDILIKGFEWELGSIANTGSLSSSSARIRIKEKANLEVGTTIEVTDQNYQFVVNQYNLDGTFVSGSNTGWIRSFTVETTALYIIAIKHISELDLTLAIKETALKIKVVPKSSIIREFKDKVLSSNANSPLTNLIKNGNFQNGLSEWSLVAASTVSSSGNELVMATTGGNGRVYQAIKFDTGDIIYRSALVKSTSNLVGIGVSGAALAYHSGGGNYEYLSDARSYNSLYTAILDTRPSGSPSININIKYVLSINLTKMFGAGNEPTTVEMDAFLSAYANRWFDGTVSSIDGKRRIEFLNENPFEAFVKGVAHRGFSAVAPENTIPAFQLAKEKGFAYVECDVRFTSDGVPVLLHDISIDRTSNGTGNLSGMTLAQVKALDFGNWKSVKYAGTKIPTLEEFILYCKQQSLHPYIEIKEGGQAEVQKVFNVVKYLGMKRNVSWIGGYGILGQIVALDPYARVGDGQSAINETTMVNTAALRTGKNEVFIHCDNTLVNASTSALCMDNDYPIEAWTVDSAKTAKDLIKLGVTGITTNALVIPTI